MKRRALKKWTRLLAGLILSWITLHISYTIWDGLRDNGRPADLAVVLGNTVNPDGTLSTRLEKRLECGLELYRSGRVKRILVSGGLGAEGYYEGTKMKEYLLLAGVPDSLIMVDNRGINTRATVINTLALRDSIHFTSVIVVSQYFHITRTKRLFATYAFEAVAGRSPRYFEWRDLYSLLREFVAFYIG